jgi:hypothetical protein
VLFLTIMEAVSWKLYVDDPWARIIPWTSGILERAVLAAYLKNSATTVKVTR